MDNARECFRKYGYIETSVKNKRKCLEVRLQEIEEESRILKLKTSADKRLALTKVLKTLGETAKDENVREFALRSINFVSIDGTENEILRLLECDLDELTVGDDTPAQLRCIPRFSISTLDGYDNVLTIYYGPNQTAHITEIELKIRGKYER